MKRTVSTHDSQWQMTIWHVVIFFMGVLAGVAFMRFQYAEHYTCSSVDPVDSTYNEKLTDWEDDWNKKLPDYTTCIYGKNCSKRKIPSICGILDMNKNRTTCNEFSAVQYKKTDTTGSTMERAVLSKADDEEECFRKAGFPAKQFYAFKKIPYAM